MKTAKWDYQSRAIVALPALLKKHQRVVAVGPTGCGKTFIAAAIIERLKKGQRVLWLAHRHELLAQARRELIAAGVAAKDVGILSGNAKENCGARVLVASVQMFRERVVPEVDLIVVDEAHHIAAESYSGIIFAQPNAQVLGLTATPWRLDGEPLGDVFNHLYLIAEAVECVADGAIRPSAVYACVDHAGAKSLTKGLVATGGDWSRNKLESRMRKAKLMGDMVVEWKRRAEDRPTLCYATTVEHAEDIAARFRANGVTADVVSWQTPQRERDETMKRLRDALTKIVVNVQVFTEGLDCPPVKCIIIARPTKSLTLYRQMIGRGSRPSGRGRPIVLDHAGNIWRLGLPDMPVEWSLYGRAANGGPCPVKQCPACEEMIPIGSRECPHCGAAQPIADYDTEKRDAVLKRVEETGAARMAKREILRKLSAVRGLDDAWVDRAMKEAL